MQSGNCSRINFLDQILGYEIVLCVCVFTYFVSVNTLCSLIHLKHEVFEELTISFFWFKTSHQNISSTTDISDVYVNVYEVQ